MSKTHSWTIVAAAIVALLLLGAMLFGGRISLAESVGVERSLRDVAVALWAFLLPAWFTLEEAWFAPPSSQAQKLAAFHRSQRAGRITWTTVSGAVAIVIGSSAPAVT